MVNSVKSSSFVADEQLNTLVKKKAIWDNDLEDSEELIKALSREEL